MKDLKQLNADNWGRTSEQYAERAHKGSGMMMPLIRNYTQVRCMTHPWSLSQLGVTTRHRRPLYL